MATNEFYNNNFTIQIDNLSKAIQCRDCDKFIELCSKCLPDNIIQRLYIFREIFLSPEDQFDFKDNFLKIKYPDSSFIYEYEYALFERGLHSPVEIDNILTYGIGKGVHTAYALRSLFYEIGLATKEVAMKDIKKAISMQPKDTLYKQILKNIEREIYNHYEPK